jgi:hypothetical protein
MRKRFVSSILAVLLAVGVFLLADSAGPADRPAPTSAPLSPAAIYRMQVRVYLSPAYVVAAQDMSPESLDQVIATLEGLEPPSELSVIHQEVLAGYRFIREGRQIKVTTLRSGGEQIAEGEFLVSWGVSRLLEAARQLPEE